MVRERERETCLFNKSSKTSLTGVWNPRIVRKRGSLFGVWNPRIVTERGRLFLTLYCHLTEMALLPLI